MKDAITRIGKAKKEIQNTDYSDGDQKTSFQIYAMISYLKQEFEAYHAKGTPYQQIQFVQLISETLKVLTKKVPTSLPGTLQSVEKLEELCSAIIEFQNLKTYNSHPPQEN